MEALTAMAHRRMPKATRMEVPMAGLTATRTVDQAGTMATEHRHLQCGTTVIAHHRRLWCAITEGQGRTMRGYKARAFHRSTVGHAMWCMTGAATACTSRHGATTGCNTAVITCWSRLPPA